MKHLDKLQHFIGGAIIALIITLLFQDALIGLGVAILVGVAKEGYDFCHPDKHTCDVWDFIATAIGGVAGVLLTLLFV